MRKHSNSLDWCFDCKQVKGMKSNANKKTRIYLKNHFCSWFVSCFRNKIYKLLIYKWLNSYILNLPDFLNFARQEPDSFWTSLHWQMIAEYLCPQLTLGSQFWNQAISYSFLSQTIKIIQSAWWRLRNCTSMTRDSPLLFLR